MNFKLISLIPIMGFFAACSTLQQESVENKEWIYPVNNEVETPFVYEEPKPLPKFVKTAEAPQLPMSAKSMDINWIHQQNPSEYTIQVASSTKPLQVSQVLIEIPKGRHSAEVKYQQGHDVYYTGVYGNFKTEEEAKESLNAMGPDIQNSAKITQWQNIQHLNYL